MEVYRLAAFRIKWKSIYFVPLLTYFGRLVRDSLVAPRHLSALGLSLRRRLQPGLGANEHRVQLSAIHRNVCDNSDHLASDTVRQIFSSNIVAHVFTKFLCCSIQSASHADWV
jgi:hypothetical protein